MESSVYPLASFTGAFFKKAKHAHPLHTSALPVFLLQSRIMRPMALLPFRVDQMLGDFEELPIAHSGGQEIMLQTRKRPTLERGEGIC